MTTDPNAPATKEDVRLVLDQLRRYYERTEGWIGDLEERLTEHTDRIKEHFDLTIETIRHELLGANRDDIESMKDRLTRLEQHTRLDAR